jgi:acetylornithine deacetylase/succinyl-diaminopimelate desuccinylase-like protein
MPMMRSIVRSATLLLALPVVLRAQIPAPQPVRPIDWNAMQAEAVETLRQYLRINTTNPPGNELASARFLKAFLEKEGIEAQLLDTVELGAGRANLYARLKGDGSKKAIALVQHMDVVPVTPAYWTVPAFDGEVKDGFVYGRGALDMKGEGIAHLMALVALKRSGVPLTRDIVFVANADEELGSTGALVFVDRHPDLLKDVEYLFTEGGSNAFRNGKLEYYSVGVAEKRTFWNRLTVKGTPSHGSRPTRANPVPRLVAALDRIARYETPLHVTPGVQKFFHDISRNYSGRQKIWLNDVTAALKQKAARDWILSDVYWNAILRNTISLTGLQGSNKTNVIPAEASAELDIRLLPDQRPEDMIATLTRIVGDTAVHFTPLLTPKAPFESPVNTDLFRAVERAAKERDPQAFVTSSMMTGATDRPTYRKLGIIAYGLSPFKVEAADEQKGVHGNDERLSVTNVGNGVRFVYDILRYAQ